MDVHRDLAGLRADQEVHLLDFLRREIAAVAGALEVALPDA